MVMIIIIIAGGGDIENKCSASENSFVKHCFMGDTLTRYIHAEDQEHEKNPGFTGE